MGGRRRVASLWEYLQREVKGDEEEAAYSLLITSERNVKAQF